MDLQKYNLRLEMCITRTYVTRILCSLAVIALALTLRIQCYLTPR